jgi:hypothetical protein
MSEDHNLVPARPIGNIYCGTCSWTDRTLIEFDASGAVLRLYRLKFSFSARGPAMWDYVG